MIRVKQVFNHDQDLPARQIHTTLRLAVWKEILGILEKIPNDDRLAILEAAQIIFSYDESQLGGE